MIAQRIRPHATARWSRRLHASTTNPAITSPNVGVRNTSESSSLRVLIRSEGLFGDSS